MIEIRPIRSPVGPVMRGSIASSMRSSSSSESFRPPAAKNLMPLSGIGLWDAEIIAPSAALWCAVRNATAGVGSWPTASTSTPCEASPAARAEVSISPETRGSLPITARGRCRSRLDSCPASAAGSKASTEAAAAPRDNARSTVSDLLARPRTPSVPNIRAMVEVPPAKVV